jgi:hypothetical protein
MKVKLLKTAFVALLLIATILPQSMDKIIVLTPEYGDTIDVDEMRIIGLINLDKYNGFQHLVFYNRSDTVLITKITFLTENGEYKDSTILSNLQLLNNLRASLRQKELTYLDALNSRKSFSITTRTGEICTGVVANVNDSGLLLISRKSIVESEPEYNEVAKRYLKKQDLSTVFIKGESKIGSGILMGALSGIVIGAGIGLVDGDDTKGWIRFTAGQKAIWGGLSFGLIGVLVGLVAGAASSSSDEYILITDDYDLNILKEYIMD